MDTERRPTPFGQSDTVGLWCVVQGDETCDLVESGLTLFEAEILLCRCCNAGMDAYLMTQEDYDS